MYIGSHVSLGGDLNKAFQQEMAEGGNCMQVFLKSPTMKSPAIKVKPNTFNHNNDFKTIVHSSYLLNFSKPPEEHPWAFQNILDDLNFASQSNILGCIIHMGKYLKTTPQQAISQYASSVMKIIDDWHEMGEATGYNLEELGCRLVLENSASQGTEIGYRWEDIVKIWDEIDEGYHHKVGFCFDTCHAFASGYDLRDDIIQDETIKYIDEHLDIENLSVVHLNDSKKECGCRVDRHENLGKGCIGMEPLGKFCQILDKKYGWQNPIILETPEMGDRMGEVKYLQSLF